jgi:hypothetical protein
VTNRPILKRRQDTACQTRHANIESDHQPFPQTTELGRNLNLPLSRLYGYAADQASVYYYIIRSMRKRNGEFIQAGCGPNFQGGLITLCTCKHRMRTYMDPDKWRGIWIAGFTGLPTGGGANFLIYLMRVAHAFKSQGDLWFSNDIPPAAKQAKAAHLDRFGDLYKPRSKRIDRWNPAGYVPPTPNHCHAKDRAKGWAKDIAYEGVGTRHAALLVGDPQRSFLWNRPMIYCSGRLHRGQKKCTLHDLLAQLKAGEPS